VSRLPTVLPDAAPRTLLRTALAEQYGICMDRIDPVRLQRTLDALPAPVIDERTAAMVAAALARTDHDPFIARALVGLTDVLREQAATAGPRPLRIWVVGAATGGGPSELHQVAHAAAALPYGARVLGTDRDPVALQGLPTPRLPRVDVWLSAADPTRDARPGMVDVVLCRGAMEILQPERRHELRAVLKASLAPGGALVLNPSALPPTDGLAERRMHGQRVSTRTEATRATVTARVQTALGFSESRRPMAAVQRLQTWASEDPSEPAYPTAAAEIALREGDAPRAIMAARAATALAPSLPTPRALLAEALILAGKDATAALADADARLQTRMPDAPLPLGMGATAAELRRRLDRAQLVPAALPAPLAATA
jgi:hypothetical protein